MPELPEKPARAWAAELVEAWIAGEQTAPIVARIPPVQAELAQALARAMCERLRFFARRAVTEGIQIVPVAKKSNDPEFMRRQVLRVIARQQRAGAAGSQQRREG